MYYLVIRHGVYMQGIFGLYEEVSSAIERAKSLAKDDVDNYHNWIVVPIPLGDGKIDDFFYDVLKISKSVVFYTNKDEHQR